MAFGNVFALLDGYDGVDPQALFVKVNADKAAAAAAAEKVAAEKAAAAAAEKAAAEAEKKKDKEEQKHAAYDSGRGRGGYGRGTNGHGRGGGRGRDFYGNGNGRFGNSGDGGRGRGGYGNGVFRGGRGQRSGRPFQEGLKRIESKDSDSAVDCKDQNFNNGDAASGREIPTTTEVPVAKDVQSEKENAEQLVSKDFPQNSDSTTVDKEEEKRKEEEDEKRKKREIERAEDAKKMTLSQYYSKVVVEKKKALEPFLKVEERKVVADEEFEGMQLIGKKKEEEFFVKLAFEKEKSSKKNNLEKEEKLRKSLSLDEFLKPAGGHRYRPVRNNYRGSSADGQDGGANRNGRALADGTGCDPKVEDRCRPPVHESADRGGRGRGRGFRGRMGQDPVRTEDRRQFPELGKASKVEAVKA